MTFLECQVCNLARFALQFRCFLTGKDFGDDAVHLAHNCKKVVFWLENVLDSCTMVDSSVCGNLGCSLCKLEIKVSGREGNF